MSRPRIPIGTFGTIGFIDRPSGPVEACARFRDWDGQIRLIQATASARPAAEIALKSKLVERNALQLDTTLTPDSPFPALVDYWLADLDLEGRIASSTRFDYERDMRRLVLQPQHYPRVPGWPTLTRNWTTRRWIRTPLIKHVEGFTMPNRNEEWHTLLTSPHSALVDIDETSVR